MHILTLPKTSVRHSHELINQNVTTLIPSVPTICQHFTITATKKITKKQFNSTKSIWQHHQNSNPTHPFHYPCNPKNLKKKSWKSMENQTNLAFKNLGSKEFDFEFGEKRRGMWGGSEERSGNLPSSFRLLKLNQPLICCNSIARLWIMVQHINCLRNLDL